MKIRLLEKGYKNKDELYQDFLTGQILEKEEYFSEEIIEIFQAPYFPIYMARESTRKPFFLEAFQTVSAYLELEREIYMDERFWHTLLLTEFREQILAQYPQIKDDPAQFKQIVIKKFDWMNYIYKCLLGSQYIQDHTESEERRLHYYQLIIENLDLYNYMIKYEIFRNDGFVLNVLDIIHDNNLSERCKAQIKDRPDLASDERVGRRVIFELNKSYPALMSPMLEKEELEEKFLDFLALYESQSTASTISTSPKQETLVKGIIKKIKNKKSAS